MDKVAVERTFALADCRRFIKHMARRFDDRSSRCDLKPIPASGNALRLQKTPRWRPTTFRSRFCKFFPRRPPRFTWLVATTS